MDKNQAIRLLDETFNNQFDKNKFLIFIKELFNEFKIVERSSDVWNEYQDYIESYINFGTYVDTSRKVIDVLVIKLKRTSSRDRARTMQRNFVAKYLGNSGNAAALVAFHGDDEDWRFSFVKMEYNLVKDEEGKAKIAKELTPAKRYSFLVGKNEPNYTCKKQFLELVMEDEINPSIDEIESAFSIDKVTKEFFMEYKGLYLQLREAVEEFIKKDANIRREFEEKAIPPVDFAKKLLGQIVFIYFLQKKGWLGVEKDQNTGKFRDWGSGPKNFMRRLFKNENYDNFFNDVLEPLFYEALATERDDDYYSRFACKIPFLNGGLFEPINDYNWRETDLLLDNDIFEKILDTFDRFNFTVKEDEPLEKEVAIDPEILGKVFENLIEENIRKGQGAYYTPREIVHYMCQQSLINYLETNAGIGKEDIEKFILLGDFALDILIKEKEKIKRYGRSYVSDEEHKLPKSIRENYKKIDDLLKTIKIVDPAVGSGAFPIGMMNEIVKARSILSIFFSDTEQKERTNYNLKREVIENCLYGVDIDSSAVEIAKLRFWLSLIVDELDMKNIKPLPNLDHKIMCGNSLLEEFEGVKLFDEKLLGEIKKDYTFEIKQIDLEISKLNQELHQIHTGKIKNHNGRSKEIQIEIKKLQRKKEQILAEPKEQIQQVTLGESLQKRIKESQKKLKELKDLQQKFFNEQNRKLKMQYRNDIERIEWELIDETLKEQGNEEAMQKLKQYKKNKAKPFFLWKLYFAEVFQRENPGFDVVIANPPYVGEKGHKEIFRLIAQTEFGKRFYQGKMDLFYFFFHRAIDMVRQKGQISFITTNYYPTALGAKKLRQDFKERTIVRQLINFNELKIFESALGQHNLITFLSKDNIPQFIAKTGVTSREGIANAEILKEILAFSDTETDYFEVPQKDLYDGEQDYVRVTGNSVDTKNPLMNILNKLKSNGVSLNSLCEINNGVHTEADYLSNKKFSSRDDKSSEIGDGIYVLDSEHDPDKLVIRSIQKSNTEKNYLKPFFKNSDIKKYYSNIKNSRYLIYINKQKDDINNLPIIKGQLHRFKRILDNSSDNSPYLHRPKQEKIFLGEKIIVPQRNKENTFGYNTTPWYSSADVYFITNKDEQVTLKYILALLNSKIYYLWLYHRGKRKGETLELYNIPLSEVPIKKISPEAQTPFIQLVDQILPITRDGNYLDNPGKHAKVKKLEKEIDQLVYKLYELTPEEIRIVEEFGK